jgi:hypothetical protein
MSRQPDRNAQPFAPGWKCSLAMVFLLITGMSCAFWFSRPASGAKKERRLNGQEIFRFDTFGDEQLWTDQLRMHRVIESSIDPMTALSLGLKVDADALPDDVRQGIQDGAIDLTSPATTLALIKLDAVVGVVGKVERIRGRDRLTEVGITCALCHSTVDDSFAPGIGRRLDGWANRDLNVGAIIALAPQLEPIANLLGVDVDTVRKVLHSWGPGKFDAELLLDGKAFRPDGKSAATLIPPAFGLAGVNLHTWTGWGSVTHWNALVANLEMHGTGTFFDPRLDDAQRFPIAAREGFGHVRAEEDLITAALPALHLYQLALQSPPAPRGSFDATAARRGRDIFNDKAKCATCHVPPIFTEPGYNMHLPEEIGIDDFQAQRSPDGRYRTAPLRGLWTHSKGGYYHDGRFATLADVIRHYDQVLSLGLSGAERADLEQYLKSL